MKAKLKRYFLLFILMLRVCSKFGRVQADSLKQCSEYQSEPESMLNLTSRSKYISIKQSPHSNNCSNSRKTVGSKQFEKSTSNQLLSWLNNMKNIWKEFPVYKSDKLSSKNVSKNQILIGCSNDKILTLSNGLKRVNTRLEGKGVVTFDDKKSYCSLKLGIEKVNGSYVNGQLEGMATIHFKNGSQVRAPFSNGTISGLTRVFTCQYGACDFDYQPWTVTNRLSEVSFYDNGIRVGPAWEFKIGGGFLIGNVDDSGHLTGNEIIYAYPDFETLLIGQFQNGIMVAANQTTFTGIKFDRLSGIPLLLCKKLVERNSGNNFKFEGSNKIWLGGGEPLLPDPYERRWIYVGESKIPGAGLGVFTTSAGKRGKLVGFYNGFKKNKLEAKLTIEDRQSSYMIDNDWAVSGQILDVPSYSRTLDRYQATLGHMINHGSDPNAWFGMIDHPRFGKIRSIILTKDVEANEELLTNYGFLEKYIETEETLKTIYKLGKWMSNKEEAEYSKSMKKHIHFLKAKVDEYKPVWNILKTAASYLGRT